MFKIFKDFIFIFYMKLLFLLNIFFIGNSFILKNPSIHNNLKLNALKNYNEKPLENMDIFEKFEYYSNKQNKEKQGEYLYKIKKHLDREYKKKSWQKNLKND